MRRTKIVCTIGPASDSPEVIGELLDAGMNMARLNFSHGDHDWHRQVFQRVREAAAARNLDLPILMDLQGPKIRTGPIEGMDHIDLIRDADFCITTREVPGDASCVSTTYSHLPSDVESGDRILMADGVLEIVVDHVDGQDVHCKVVRGGLLGSHKGINLPGVAVSAPAITEKDYADIELAGELGADFVALSFVRSADDVVKLRTRLEEIGATADIVSKIERPEALVNFDAILDATDAVMVARGDLGVEIPLEDVPQAQKNLVQRCNDRGKPVITATQMLESMVLNARPTRAEAGDVANAIYDGADAVMLSAETASGAYPIDAVLTMAAIAAKADDAVALEPRRRLFQRVSDAHIPDDSFADAIGQAAGRMAQMLDVKRIVCYTRSGYTVRAMARYRPCAAILAMAPNEAVARKSGLLWGVEAVHIPHTHDTDGMILAVEGLLRDRGYAAPGDTVLVVAGLPVDDSGSTNMLKLHRIPVS